jgi:hypothetical protein
MSRRTKRFIDGYDLCRLLEAVDVRDRTKAIDYCVNLPRVREAFLVPEEQVIGILADLIDNDDNILRLLAGLKVWTLEEITDEGLWIMSLI